SAVSHVVGHGSRPACHARRLVHGATSSRSNTRSVIVAVHSGDGLARGRVAPAAYRDAPPTTTPPAAHGRLTREAPVDKDKALDLALANIEKQFGKGSLMKLGDEAAVQVAAIPTGALSLDLALGIG